MAVILNRSGKQWLLMALLLLVQATLLITLLLRVPQVADGARSWFLWIVVLAANVLIAHRYFAPQKERIH